MNSRTLRLKCICESLELLLLLGQLSDTGPHLDGPLYGGEGAEGTKHRHLHRPTVSPPANQMEQQHSLPPKAGNCPPEEQERLWAQERQERQRGCGHEGSWMGRKAVGMSKAGQAEEAVKGSDRKCI